MARGLGLPFTSYAVDGARTADVAREQLAAFDSTTARREARYDLGCVYAGVNDVRAPGFDPTAYARDLETVVAAVKGRCDRVLAATIPHDLGRPRAPKDSIDSANGTIERIAQRHGALVLDLRDFGARNHVMVDHVHPTAFGQVAIAERALDVLARDGLSPRVRPKTLINPAERTRWRALRGDATYCYRRLKEALRAAQAGRGSGAPSWASRRGA